MAEQMEVLGAELAQEENYEITQKLATAPPQTDIARSGVQRQIIYADHKAERWVSICQLALGMSCITDERMIALELEVANGLRREPIKNLEAALDRLEGVKPYLDALPYDNWHTRLLGLWAYHGAIIYEDLGEYSKSADCHQQTADLGGDKFSFLCAKHMATRALLLDAILNRENGMSGTTQEQFQNASQNFLNFLFQKHWPLPEDPNYVRWIANVAFHRAQVALLSQDSSDSAYKYALCVYTISPEEIHDLFLQNALLAKAMMESYSGATISAKATFELAGKTGDIATEALLIIFLKNKKVNATDDADKIAQQILALEGYGGYIPKKIAQEWLESRRDC